MPRSIAAYVDCRWKLLGSLLLVAVLAVSARGGAYHMVDADNATGDMTIGLINQSYSGGQWHFTLLATNTGMNTYNDVHLVEQFIWDRATSPQSPLAYSNSNSWAAIVNSQSDTFSLASYAIGAGPATAPVPFLWTSANTPLTWGGNLSQGLATISSSDTLPAIPLGNFGPGASQTFTMNCAVPNYFLPDVLGFYVAVPEPSTIALLLAGGAGWLAFRWRRRVKG